MRVAILGCGPSGLLAAHAAEVAGAHEVDVFSIKEKSKIMGAQYIHAAIPAIPVPTPPGQTVKFVKVGTREGYAQKVYGDPNAPCSWDLFEGEVPAWSMRDTYDALWDYWEPRIWEMRIGAATLSRITSRYDLTISTIPARGLCELGATHKFLSASYKVLLHAADPIPENTIVYNGDPAVKWYRSSRVFGEGSTEYPAGIESIQPLASGFKPLSTDCDCHPEIIRAGRFGRWEKGVLVHDAFFHALAAMKEAAA